MEKETKIYGIRAIMEAIEAENAIDKVFLQKGLSGDLFAALENYCVNKTSTSPTFLWKSLIA